MDIDKALGKFADSDMRLARKEGAIYITETRGGLLELSYADGTYHLTTCTSTPGVIPTILARGAARFVKPILMQQYQVVYA